MIVLVVALILVGFVASLFGSLLGLGGGVIVVPSLLFLHHFFSMDPIPNQEAVAISLAVMIVTGLSSVMAYSKRKQVDYKSAFVFLIGIAPGALVGTYITRLLTIDMFTLYFGLFMLLVAVSLFLKPRRNQHQVVQKSFMRSGYDEAGNAYTYGFSIGSAILVSFGVGTLSSLFGVGGGVLMVPIMIMWFGFPVKIATATAMLIVFFSALFGTGAHYVSGHIDWFYVLALIPGAWFGAKAGAWLNKKVQSNHLIVLLRFVFIALALQVVIQAIL